MKFIFFPEIAGKGIAFSGKKLGQKKIILWLYNHLSNSEILINTKSPKYSSYIIR